MSFTQTTITGPIYLPNGSTPFGGRVSFELSSWDQEEGEALVLSGPVYAEIDENGQFSVELFTTTAGNNFVHYRMFVLWEDSELAQSYVNNIYVSTPTPHFTKKYIGSFALSGAGPFQVSDLSIINETDASSFDAYLEMRAFSDRIDLGEFDADVEQVNSLAGQVYDDRIQTGLDRGQTTLDRAATAADVVLTHADVVLTGADSDAADAARVLAEAARDAAIAGSIMTWPTTAAGIGSGIASTTSLVGGSGGTNGTFALAYSSGTQVLPPVGVFTVNGAGQLASVLITYPGYYSAGAPTLVFTASSGLTGASATAQMAANTPVNGFFAIPSTVTGEAAVIYKNVAGVATEAFRTPSAAAVKALTFFPRADATITAEIAAFSRVQKWELFGANNAKFYSIYYLWWKDVGSRFRMTIYQHDDLIGTGATEVCGYTLASGADVWTGPIEIPLAAVGGSGITGTATLDFTDTTALSMNLASTTAAMYTRRAIHPRVLASSTARSTDIAAQAAAGLAIRRQVGVVSLFLQGGNDTQTGARNAGFGYSTLDSLTDGFDNAAFGYNSLTAVTGGDYNSAFGSDVMPLTTGDGNTAIGYSAMRGVTTGTQNSGIGFQCGYTNTTGSYNVNLGARAGYSCTTAFYNVAIGYSALFSSNVTGNTAVGESCGLGVTSAANFTAVGRRAAYTKTTGNDCSFFGHQAGYSGATGEVNTGEGNTAIGAYSFGHNTSGAYNTGVGRASGWYGSSGSRNTYSGYRTGYGNTVGNDNVAAGFYSGHNVSTGSKNLFLGAYADGLVPASSMTATAVAGAGLGIGAYNYRITFVLDGVETALSEPAANATTTGGNQQINLAVIPTYTGPRTCSARKVYRTPLAGEGLLYLVTTIADNTTTTYSDTLADGSLGAQPTQISSSMAIGYAAQALKSNQMVVGSPSSRITEAYIGGGVDDTAPAAVTLSSSNASGSNVAGANLRLRAGASTGSGASGKVILSAGAAGGSGTTHNAVTDWVTLDGNGCLTIVETTSAAVPTPAAGSVNLFFEGGAMKFRNSAGTVLTVAAS